MSDSLEGFNDDELRNMAATYDALLKNPETREVTLRATKKLNPHLSIPEVDLKDAARGEFAKINERQQALENEIRMRDAKERIERERQALRDQGMSKDDVAAIEKIMTDEQIPSYQTAAKFYEQSRRLAEPTPNNGAEPGSTWQLPNDPLAAAKGGKAGLSKFAREQAEAAMAELRSGRIKLQ